MCVKDGFVARFERRRDDAHFLPFAHGHARHNLLQERFTYWFTLGWTDKGSIASKVARIEVARTDVSMGHSLGIKP